MTREGTRENEDRFNASKYGIQELLRNNFNSGDRILMRMQGTWNSIHVIRFTSENA